VEDLSLNEIFLGHFPVQSSPDGLITGRFQFSSIVSKPSPLSSELSNNHVSTHPQTRNEYPNCDAND
jgi:hypothetical protein